MNFKKKYLFVFLTAFLFSGLSYAFEIPKSKINEIKKPLFALPAIVKQNSAFDLELSLPRDAELKRVSISNILTPKEDAKNLFYKSLKQEGDIEYFSIEIPSTLKTGLYDLSIKYLKDGKEFTDTQPHSVKIIKEFKKEFIFAHITDYHVGDSRGKGDGAVDFEQLRKREIQEISGFNPEFVLMTGDITYFPLSFDKEYETAYNEILKYSKVPFFIIPGNHDLFRFSLGEKNVIDGLDYWKAVFGELYFSFDYGEYHFAGLNTFDWPSNLRLLTNKEAIQSSNFLSDGAIGRSQFIWLENDFKKAQEQGKHIIIFAHHDPLTEMKSESIDKKYDIVPIEEFISLLKKFGVEYYFCGHNHQNLTINKDGITYIHTATSGSDLDGKDGWGFKTVKVKEDGAIEMEFNEIFPKPVDKQ